MLAPEIGSTNPGNNDKTPLMRSGVFKRLSSLVGGVTERHYDSGYVEFGSLNEASDLRTLGTFAGVFSPVTLSMFSALIFLRVGFIVGNAGLLTTLLQFVIAYIILIFTITSICAISTNGEVEGGGAYFMISRTLGPEFGGSIGTLFFLANIVSSALYISGCVEGLTQNIGPSGILVGKDSPGIIPDGYWYRFLYSTILNTLNLLICLIGASMFAKTTVLVLIIVIVCIGTTTVSFFIQYPMQVHLPDSNTLVQNITYGNYTGLSSVTLSDNLWSNYGKDYTSKGDGTSFAVVFGVLFSGVTGIMAGANMSGELKNPGKSIPIGTLSAAGFTFVVYICLSLLTAATCERFLLQNNYLYMASICVWPVSVAIGLITATWSAALSNVIGSSRVLEALAKDKVFGPLLNFIPKGTWRSNPIAAVLVSWLLVQCVLLIGSLNAIAQLNSVLFLLSYLATNLACLGLELASAPNFRPAFKYFTWHTALVGLIGTLIMMFVINPIYASCSILLCLTLVVFLHLFSPSKEAQWGSISQALIFHQVRKYLLLLDSRKDHVKFWRPQVLLLVNSPRSACPLIDFINDLKKGGLYVLGHVIKGEPHTDPDPVQEMYPNWLSLIDHLKVKAFAEITVAPTVREGVQHLVRLSGMGAMKPNTVVFGFLDKEEPKDFLESIESPYKNQNFSNCMFTIPPENGLEPTEYVKMIDDVLRLKKNVCLCRNFYKLQKDAFKNSNKGYIDVWPVNLLNPNEKDAFDNTSLFMMQLACIVNMVPKWSKLTLRICVCDEVRQSSFTVSSSSDTNTDRLEIHINKLQCLLDKLRISAKIFPVNGWNPVIEIHEVATESYLKSINQLILQQSGETAITFIYLPIPPSKQSSYTFYLKAFETITKDLPPSVLVHGINTVTSTTL
ncbi:solute carrier family 12 member 9 isoform X2 [Agrilus planipennis]|uniref:Solute carrier family 12 member 9 n=1 Tax=Agrilus planipennis TaxID=224129 RepID=A0A1W4XW25_AGRPL|nr:solute carrier family 12 member 9 isoform X2 [Agrilus planipennis]